jgi:hypothetical protein
VAKLRINFGSQVTAIEGIVDCTCFFCAGFKIFKEIIYYSIFFLALVIISDIIINELSVI